jgi:hypothetical protein
MDAIRIVATPLRPRCPSQSELAARASQPGNADVARHANKVATDALMLRHRLDAILDRHRGWDDYPEQRARADARQYRLPGPLRSPQGWVEFSHHPGRVIGIR